MKRPREKYTKSSRKSKTVSIDHFIHLFLSPDHRPSDAIINVSSRPLQKFLQLTDRLVFFIIAAAKRKRRKIETISSPRSRYTSSTNVISHRHHPSIQLSGSFNRIETRMGRGEESQVGWLLCNDVMIDNRGSCRRHYFECGTTAASGNGTQSSNGTEPNNYDCMNTMIGNPIHTPSSDPRRR